MEDAREVWNELDDVNNIMTLADVVYPGLHDISSDDDDVDYSYIPQQFVLEYWNRDTQKMLEKMSVGRNYYDYINIYMIPERAQFKNNGLRYDNNIRKFKQQIEEVSYKSYVRKLNREYPGSY